VRIKLNYESISVVQIFLTCPTNLEMGILNIVEHWSQAIRYNLRCASVAASIPARRLGQALLGFYGSGGWSSIKFQEFCLI